MFTFLYHHIHPSMGFFSYLNFLHYALVFVYLWTCQHRSVNELLVCAFASCGYWICAHHSGESPLCTCDASLKADCRHSCFRVHKNAQIICQIWTDMQKYAKITRICPNLPFQSALIECYLQTYSVINVQRLQRAHLSLMNVIPERCLSAAHVLMKR